MGKVVITLQDRASGENFTVEERMRGGHPVWIYHERALKKNPGCFIRKSVVRR